jgi:hypothetical protein
MLIAFGDRCIRIRLNQRVLIIRSAHNLVGQPIFNQIFKIIPKEVINRIVLEQKSDRYYKSFSTWDELITLLFGIFTRCDSAREVCDGMAALGGKLNYLGMDSSPAKSTFNDGLNNRKEQVFEKIYKVHMLTDKAAGVLKEEHIHLKYTLEKVEKTLCLRKVTYRDEKGRIFQFITNNWNIENCEVALIYKLRWTIELVFKKLKQNFQLHFFYSESENGIKTQVWATLIAHLLLTVLKRMSKSKKAFSTIAALIRIYFISHLDLYWVIENGRRSYQKRTKSKNKVPAAVQILLFDG